MLDERQSFVDRQNTPWTDIAYMVDDTDSCNDYINAYLAPKFECVELWPVDQSGIEKRKHRSSFDNQFDCEAELPMFRGFREHEQNMNMNIIHVQNHVPEHDFSEHMFSHVLNMMFQIMFLKMNFWNTCSATFKNICFEHKF